jgi:hypothetical protein
MISMETWEYKTLKVETKGFFGGKVDLHELEEELNALGGLGWELANTFDTSMGQGASREVVCIFKRKRT